jgi:predicted alpha-1,2-mannosidase
MRFMLAAILTLLIATIGLTTGAAARDVTRWVDPFIGTGGHGHTYPGATVPFGMVQLSPDTRLSGWDGCSGYHHDDVVVYGFSHTHLSGTGVSDYGDILLMPMAGEATVKNGAEEGPDSGYASRFDKASEAASPGWYQVHLKDEKIDVELTATERTGIHRYRYPGKEEAFVVLDLDHRDEVLDAALRVVSPNEIAGYRRSTAWATDQIVYFVARFSQPIVEAKLFLDGRQSAAESLSGEDLRAILSFGELRKELIVQVAISAVDEAGARRNLDSEFVDNDFEWAKRKAAERWQQALSVVQLDSASKQQRTVFYTSLYHSLLAPNLFSDVDNRYRGMDREIHTADDRRHYTVFSLWDTFRATHPLLTLIEPLRVNEFIETFLAQYEQGGRLPVWELAGNETDCMIGYHSVSVIADAYAKGIRDYDASAALDAMVDSATQSHFGLDAYQRQGFIGISDESESVSKTLEYGYDDWCIARMADELGEESTARQFYARSEAWRHLYDEESGFFRARENQGWLTPFDPHQVDNNYTEANAWQYSLFVPHNVAGLIDATGGAAEFVEKLDGVFSASSHTTGREQADITGLIGQYVHGNEPSHHMAWLYHFAGQPWRSHERVRQILETMYQPTPDGLSGNEDCGQMSSWYVLSALGLYAVAPGSDQYLVTAPLFRELSIDLGGRSPVQIRSKGRGRYVQGFTIDGEPQTRSFIRHGELLAARRIEFTLGNDPSPTWGVDATDRPHSSGSPYPVVAAPFIASGDAAFRGSQQIELASPDSDAALYVRAFLDGAESPEEWQPYTTPIRIDASTTLEFYAETDGEVSQTLNAHFHRIPHDWTIHSATDTLGQYTAGGDLALIDGLRGALNWRAGRWQGYQGTPLEVTVDLGTTSIVREVGASFIQDVRSWIWMPERMNIELSLDGESFVEVAQLHDDTEADDYEVQIKEWVTAIEPSAARWVRFTAETQGPIPEWHLGFGSETILFVDELLITTD